MSLKGNINDTIGEVQVLVLLIVLNACCVRLTRASQEVGFKRT